MDRQLNTNYQTNITTSSQTGHNGTIWEKERKKIQQQKNTNKNETQKQNNHIQNETFIKTTLLLRRKK